ncbi:hypothetical protein D0Z03_002038 [Geotrichum reessii]|nr:hypothetical protein D0Z03_002038 [Galactomyces reessii]
MSKSQYLLSIPSVRERCSIVFAKALNNELTNFDTDLSKIPDLVDFLGQIIARDYGTDYASIPPHGRWQHFNVSGVKRVEALVHTWEAAHVTPTEITKRLVDLFVVSVLLDAGAGNKWSYTVIDNGTDNVYNRSEGLAVASLDMFKQGTFSAAANVQPHQVNMAALTALTPSVLGKGLQVSDKNPLDSLDGRAGLLKNLGAALTNTVYFGVDGRPGNIVDFLLEHPSTSGKTVQLTTLWDALVDGLSPVWPAGRTKLDGVSLGDAWPCSSMPQDEGDWAKIVPFHKLTQWLCYSLLVPMKKYLGLIFVGEELQTGLPEYRNGGLLVDFGVLTLKPEPLKRGQEFGNSEIPLFTPDSDVIVEWRATTVGFLDYLLDKVNAKLGLVGENKANALSLAQLLEAGTWKAGREIAAKKRPETKEPPISILSDGTVF